MFCLQKNNKTMININKSKFFGYCFFVEKIEDCDKIIANLSHEHLESSHVCYAYIIGKNQEIQNYFDANEPKKTAGFQILNLLLKSNITNCLIVVVRYFGGVKLGIGLLSRTYLRVAKELVQNNLTEYFTYQEIIIKFSYSLATKINNWVLKNKVFILDKEFGMMITYKLKVKGEIVVPNWIKQLIFR